MTNKKKRDWREVNIRLGGVSLTEILNQLAEWVEDKAQEVPFKSESETFRREWDFQIAGQLGHFEIMAKISSKSKKGR